MGGKSRLSNKPIFPQPLCLSQQHKHGKEPEAHTSGACLLLPPDTRSNNSQGLVGNYQTYESMPNLYVLLSSLHLQPSFGTMMGDYYFVVRHAGENLLLLS